MKSMLTYQIIVASLSAVVSVTMLVGIVGHFSGPRRDRWIEPRPESQEREGAPNVSELRNSLLGITVREYSQRPAVRAHVDRMVAEIRKTVSADKK